MLGAYLLLGALFGYLGFREARNFERTYGKSPWGLEPILWGLLVFFAGIFIGGILLMVARRNTKKSLSREQTFAQHATPVAGHPTFGQPAFAPVGSDPSNPYAAPTATAPVSTGRHPGAMDILPGAN